MALRHQVPAGFGEYCPAQDLVVPPAMRVPVTLEFRKGADMKSLVAQIRDHVSVKVDAAVGAGKSTLLPKELALATGSLVFHVVANPLLARSIHSYVSKMANEDSVAFPALDLFASYEQQIPKTGVFYIGAAAFVGLLLRHKTLKSFTDCFVFLDEAHESDAFTHIVRNLSLPMGAGSLVQASATFSPSGFRQVECSGHLAKKTYDPKLVPDVWDLEDISRPWCYAAIRDSLVIFSDSRTQVRSLSAKYNELGIRNFSLTANMPSDKYDEAIAAMWDKRGELVVIFADSSFRSGFTWNTSRIIDTGKVSYYDPEPGKLVKRTRNAFAFELEQAAGRGGRFRGLNTEYYQPDYLPEAMTCELEGVEAEAAAYLYRMLGYKPVRELKNCCMAQCNLPGDIKLETALGGCYPLTYYIVDSVGNLREHVTAQSVDDIDVMSGANPRVQIDEQTFDHVEFNSKLAEYADNQSSRLSGSTKADSVVDQLDEQCKASAEQRRTTWDDMDDALGIPGSDGNLELGRCYMVQGLSRINSTRVRNFPDGLHSVVRLLAGRKSAALFSGLHAEEVDFALKLVQDRYNFLNIEISAMQMAFSSASLCERKRCSIRVRDHFVSMLETATALGAERKTLFDIFRGLLVASRRGVLILDDPEQLICDRALQIVEGTIGVIEELDDDEQIAYGRMLAERVQLNAAMNHGFVEDSYADERPKLRPKEGLALRGGTGSNDSDEHNGVNYNVIKSPFWARPWLKQIVYGTDKRTGKLVEAIVNPSTVAGVLSGIGHSREYEA